MSAELQKQVEEAFAFWNEDQDFQCASLIERLKKLEPKKKDDQPLPNKKAKLSPTAEGNKQNFKTPTKKDAALLVVDHYEEGDLFYVVENDVRSISPENFARDVLKEEITRLENENITYVIFRNTVFDEKNPKESYKLLQRMVCPQTNVKLALQDLFQTNQAKHEGGGIMVWEEDFVRTTNYDFHFPLDLTKGPAYVISGESGSGKSWFAKKYLPKRLDGASFIYHELGDTDAELVYEASCNALKPSDGLGSVYQTVMQELYTKGYMGGLVYNVVSELSRKHNEKRNKAARIKFESLMQKAVEKSSTVNDWWQKPSFKLDQLVIILDEMGKNPDLARGLVDEVRQIYVSIFNKGLAEKVLLVLVGAGIDRYITNDSLDLDTDPEERNLYAKFGTDPSKSELTTILGPDFEGRGRISGIPVMDIMGGKYSRVLATNTRMLTRGVIPILKSEMNTLRVDNPSERRVELGSTNIVMDYAARVYICLNGLARLKKEVFEALLLSQFRLLVFGALRSLQTEANPAFKHPFTFNTSNYESVLKAGLITADIVKTSSALRYLSCKGQTAPLDAQGGVAFEIVIQHHLVRLCKAKYNADRETGKPNPKYYCGRYDLAQAWPPSSTKKNGLDDEEEVSKEIDARYKNELGKSRSKKDAEEIANLLKEDYDEYDLVLRQTVNNVQGADVLVLSKRLANADTGQVVANLDLYQAKHCNKVPSLNSNETTGAFSSLGVTYDDNVFQTEPKVGSAGYSYKGTQKFVEELSNKLKLNVRIRKRVVVFSQGWESFQNSKSWQNFNFDLGSHQNVWVWTGEMLEPTISALVSRSPVEVADSASD